MINGRKVLLSFRFAGQGIIDLFRYENNARVHLLVAILVIGASFWLGVSRVEWAIILTQIGLVWAAEAINTAIEKLCDFVSPGRHPQIKAIKDLAAGAVLILSIVAVLTGILILGGRILELVNNGSTGINAGASHPKRITTCTGIYAGGADRNLNLQSTYVRITRTFTDADGDSQSDGTLG